MPPCTLDCGALLMTTLVMPLRLDIASEAIVTEPEVTNLLGSPRAFRRFSLEFDVHLAKLPFRVRIETGEGGKRYVREGDR